MSGSTSGNSGGFFFSADALLFLLAAVSLSVYLLAADVGGRAGNGGRAYYPELEALAQDAVEVCALNLTLDEGCFSAVLRAANPRVRFCLNSCEPAGAQTVVVERNLPQEWGFSKLAVWIGE
ncbi:hypothetical protein HYS54_04285 [Candidatus Micrarchaeota archaeon]|nr:hypothetical protein [Candidatus Micrarchaeota archaeon]